jgi:hypothetical protein
MEEFADFTLVGAPDDRVVVKRDERGVWTNIPHLVTHHSPTGFEFGYLGSGPADLALNIVEQSLNRAGYVGERTACWRGDCFTAAFLFHQEFKRTFIASIPYHGTEITYRQIDTWVRDHLLAERVGRPVSVRSSC